MEKTASAFMFLFITCAIPLGAISKKKARGEAKRAARKARQEAGHWPNAQKMLIAGIKNEDVDMVERALALGASISPSSHPALPPLGRALLVGNQVIINRLLDDNLLIGMDPCTVIKTLWFPYNNGVRNAETFDCVVSKLAAVCPGLLRFVLAKHNKRDFLTFLIKRGAPVNGADSDGCTALIFAAQEGRLDEVKLLVKHGADLELSDNEGRTPLMMACRKGGLAVVRFLVGAGANICVKSSYETSALHFSCARNQPAIALFLLQHGAKLDTHLGERVCMQEGVLACEDEADSYDPRQSPLYIAIENNNIPLLRVLLRYGARIDRNSLMYAIDRASVDAAALLLICGGRRLYGGIMEQTAVCCTTHGTKLSRSCRAICDRTCNAPQGSDYWRLFQCAQEIIKKLNAFPNHKECSSVATVVGKECKKECKKNNTRVLLSGIDNGNIVELKRLLQAQYAHLADADLGLTVLMHAVRKVVSDSERMRLSVIRILLDDKAIRATINARDTKGCTALMMAVSRPDITSLLLQAGADVTMCDMRGNSLLFYAVKSATTDHVASLLQMDAVKVLINKVNEQGKTPLVYAVQRANVAMVTALLDAGADYTIRDNKQQGMVDIVRKCKKITTVACGVSEQRIAAYDQITQLLQGMLPKPMNFSQGEPISLPKSAEKKVQRVASANELVTELLRGRKARLEQVQMIAKASPGLLTQQLSKGRTPLMVAVQSGVKESVLRWMLTQLSNEHICLKESSGKQALDFAQEKQRLHFVQLLAQYIVDSECPPAHAVLPVVAKAVATPDQRLLEAVLDDQKIALVKLALRDGANINVRDAEGETALLRALKHNNSAIAQELIMAGANLNVQDEQGSTALIVATKNGRISLAASLLARGADALLCDATGRDAYAYAVSYGYDDLVKRMRVAQAHKQLRSVVDVAHALARHHEQEGSHEVPYIKYADDDGSPTSFFPSVWRSQDVYEGIRKVLCDPHDIAYDAECLRFEFGAEKQGVYRVEGYKVSGRYRGVQMEVKVGKMRDGRWKVFTAYPLLARG